ncbi:MAG: purine-binding chemotaxis protein CheW [Lachnospiraceae bacterium]|nr:purine-binding chemotaxis protein CheW [Lachnospiraceae bacterium]
MDANKITQSDAKQYIVVTLGNEQYGIDIQYVDNIVRMQRITRVPKAQPYFKGVMNIRGEIIPVMSLRLKFGLEEDEFKNSTRILIIKLEPQSAIGIIVDEVKEVVTIGEESIDKVVAGTADEKATFLSGVGKHGDGLISLLNLQNVIIEKEAEQK